jgi:hypothetical protein
MRFDAPYSRVRGVLLVSALACMLALALAACGSSSSTSSSAAAAAGGGGGGTGGTASQARLKFATCMRAHGVNVPDPSANGGPPAGGGGGGGAGGGFRALRSSPNFAPAFKACGGALRGAGGFGNISPAQRAQFQQQLVKFAECMRSHNIDIPDPSTSGGGGFGILRQIPQSERNSPAFQAALKSCSSVLPRFGRRGGGGPGGGGPPASGSSA